MEEILHLLHPTAPTAKAILCRKGETSFKKFFYISTFVWALVLDLSPGRCWAHKLCTQWKGEPWTGYSSMQGDSSKEWISIFFFFHPANTALNKVLHTLSLDLSKIKFEFLFKTLLAKYPSPLPRLAAVIPIPASCLFAEAQIAVWVSWCRVVFQLELTVFYEEHDLAFQCLLPPRCLLSLKPFNAFKELLCTAAKGSACMDCLHYNCQPQKAEVVWAAALSGTSRFNFIF